MEEPRTFKNLMIKIGGKTSARCHNVGKSAKASNAIVLDVTFYGGSVTDRLCATDGAPFPEDIRFTAPEQFIFRAQGNWAYPANTVSGEKMRLSWLDNYLSRSHLCPSGHKILQRTPEYLKLSPKKSAEDQQQRWITYIGGCAS